MVVWLIFLLYLGVGAFAALHVGAWYWAREKARFEVQHREYPTIYTEIDEEGDLYIVVLIVGLCWPLAWPVWRIASLIKDADKARTHERIADAPRSQT